LRKNGACSQIGENPISGDSIRTLASAPACVTAPIAHFISSEMVHVIETV
jgi:hypothetical protein